MTDLKHLIDKKITETFYISKPPTAQVKYAKYTARSTTARRKQPVDIELGKDETVLMQALRGPKELAKPKPRHQSAGMSQALENSLQSDPWKSHKKIALAQHPLLIEAIKAWWNVMDPHDENDDSRESGTRGYITEEQYMDLNIRIQKATQRYFNYEEAKQIAIDDWNIDSTDWNANQNSLKIVNFDKFLDFLCEMSEIWTEVPSIEALTIAINSIMLRITTGVHLNTSIFKELELIEILPVQVETEIRDVQIQNKFQENLEFIKWYQLNFLEINPIRKDVQTRLMRIFPFEARNKDLWIQENGYNQTTVLLQCTTRLEYLLNQITRQTVKPSIVLEKPMSPKLKPQTQNTNRHKRIESKVLTLNHINEQTEPDPEVHSNRIVINRKVKLSLFGQSISTRSSAADRLMELNNKETDPMAYSQTSRKEVSVALQNRLPVVTARIVSETAEYSNQNNSESLFADTPHSSKRIIFVRSKSLLVDSNPNNTLEDNPIIPRKYSFDENNLFEESPDPEYSPNINYKKIDVKLHKINKKWRSGKYFKDDGKAQEMGLGNVNRRSPELFIREKRMVAQKIIGDVKTGTPYRDLFLEDNFSDNFPISPKPVLDGKNLETEVQRTRDEPDKEVGFKVSIRVSPPHKRSASPQHNEIIDRDTFKHSIANSIRTAPNMTRYTARTELIPKVIPAEYNFEEYAHLLQQSKKPEKVVFYDNLEFFYALNKAKHEFNKTYQSEFIRNYNKNAEDYRSRRDELEGAISGHDWKEFIQRLEKLISLTKNRRKLRRARRKKRGLKLVPPKIVNGIKQPNLQKNRLWKSVFINTNKKNQEIVNNHKYLTQIHTADESKLKALPPPLQKVVNETTKIPRPPTTAKPARISERRFSPARHKSP